MKSKDGRPLPPDDLTLTQAGLWRDIVASEPASYFESPSNQALLVELVRQVQTSGFLSRSVEVYEDVEFLDPENAKAYAKLLSLREQATRTIASLATRLRLTNQSRYTPQAAATAAKNNGGASSNPWDFSG